MKLLLDSESVSKALQLATQAHKGQVDKAGKDYILHPVAVAASLQAAEAQTAALLHDTVEDTPVTLDDLRTAGFSDAVVDAVDHLTHCPGISRQEYLQRITENSLAIQVKLADLAHNSDISRIPSPTEKDLARVQRYAKEIEFLKAFL